MRAREDAKKDLMSARHRLSKMVLRNGLRFTETGNWTLKHRAQHRLHRRCYRLKEDYRKPLNVVAVAIARELVGFIRAVLHHENASQAG